jgi:UPF0271 protein
LILPPRSTSTGSAPCPALLLSQPRDAPARASGNPDNASEPPADTPDVLLLRLRLGPRHDWLSVPARDALLEKQFSLSVKTNRVGARLVGPTLTRSIAGELPSEGIVLGAVQVPPDGQPLIFLADPSPDRRLPGHRCRRYARPRAARPGPPGRRHKVRAVDLNADIGEGFGIWRLGDDDVLLGLVTSASVACGFHAGDAVTMRRVCEWAADREVAVGAQVGYRDLAGFGRRRIDYDPSELRDEIIYQIAALDGFCRLQGERVRFVKPHGALYNTAAIDVWQASAIVAAITDIDRSLPVLCQPGSRLAEVAEGAGLRVVFEGYPDRAYADDGTLLSRTQPGSVVSDVESVVGRAFRLATAGEIESVHGKVIPCPVESLCMHGDTPGAVELVTRVRESLEAAGLRLAPFVRLL